MKLGLSSYSFGWAVGVAGHEPARPMNENDLLDYALAHDLSLLQIGDNLPLHGFDAARLEGLAQRAKAENIEIEIGARGLTPEHLALYLGIARQLDAKLLRFVLDGPNLEPSLYEPSLYEPSLDDVAKILRDVLGELRNVRIGVENHDRFLARDLRRMIDRVGDERVGICLDTANSLGAGEGLREVADALAPVTLNLHIKDFSIARLSHMMGFEISGRAAGSGMMNWPALIEQLAPFNRCRSAVLELWTPPQANIDATIAKEAAWVAQSLKYLKALRCFD